MSCVLRRTAVVLAALLLTACAAPDVLTSSVSGTPSNTSAAAVVETSRYTADEISEIVMTETTAALRDNDCTQWDVELGDDSASQSTGSARHIVPAPICRTSDVQPTITSSALSAEQVSDFRAMLDQVDIGTWNAWLADQGAPPPLPSGALIYTVTVHVGHGDSASIDTFTITWGQPPGWSDFFAAVQQIAPE